jgi:DNA-binding MarR family transcriptional regulator
MSNESLFMGTKMSDVKPTLNEQEKAVCLAVYNILDGFTDLQKTITAQSIKSFLLVCLDEGNGSTEYAERLGVNASIMTRYLLDWSERNRAREEGFNFIQQNRDTFDLRRQQAILKPPGKTMVHKMVRNIAAACRVLATASPGKP